jgi:hypothetical protein
MEEDKKEKGEDREITKVENRGKTPTSIIINDKSEERAKSPDLDFRPMLSPN